MVNRVAIVSQLWLPLIPIRQLTVFSRISGPGVKISAKRSGAHQVFLSTNCNFFWLNR